MNLPRDDGYPRLAEAGEAARSRSGVAPGWERGDRGFTLLEMVVTLAVIALLVPAAFALSQALLSTLPKQQAQIAAMHDLQQLNYWLGIDANSAARFTAGSNPDYGTFHSTELSTGSGVKKEVRYYYQGASVFREEKKASVIINNERIADNIRVYGDLTFTYTAPAWTYDSVERTWAYTEAKVVATAKSTIVTAAETAQDVNFTHTIQGHLRPQELRDVSIPGQPPAGAAGSNEVTFYVNGNPTVLNGTYDSGTGADLKREDGTFYEVNGTGSPVRTAAFEATSETINYTTITGVVIEYAGQGTRANISIAVHVYNPTDPAHTQSGYDVTGDIEDTWAVKNVTNQLTFSLGDTDVDYLNTLGTKTIKVKVVATHGQNFELRSDKLIFKVSGTPGPGFVRDLGVNIDEEPIVVTGTYGSGGAVELLTNDTSYFSVNSANVSNVPTATFTLASEVIPFSSISSIELFYVSQVDRVPTTARVYVFNVTANGGSGYSSTPSATASYSATGTDMTLNFVLSAADVAYINSLSPKQVILKVTADRAAGGQSFTLRADHFIFRVTP